MDGYLLVDKPDGISSFGVVGRIRWIIKEATGQKIKVGHTGTLDPMANGLLIIVVGKYTKKAAEFSKMDKVYRAELTLGAISTTGDREGELAPKSVHRPSSTQVEKALNTFTGEIMQTPPSYSAIKIGGQRAYKLARAGKEVKLEPRKAQVHSLKIISYNYPNLNLITEVSSGTYIRSLGEDIGNTLGTGAYLSALRRTKVGRYDVSEALELDAADYDLLLRNLKS
jgi:tRNA pseudouridine55 synthase